MTYVLRRGSLGLAILFALISVGQFTGQFDVYAQEAKATAGKRSKVDEAMIRALEEEYENREAEPDDYSDRIENGDSDSTVRRSNQPIRSYQSTRPVNDAEFVVVDEEENDKDLWTLFRLEVLWWAAGFGDTDVTSRTGLATNTYETTDENIAEYGKDDYYGTLLYRLDIGFHPVVSISGLFYHADLKSQQTLTNQSFFFDGQGFSSGDDLESRFRITTAEINLNVHVVNVSWFRLDLLIGGRYMKVELEYKRRNVNTPVAKQRFEGLTPMIGLGFIARPTGWLHLYGSAQVGALEYDASDDREDGRRIRSETDERYLAVVALEAGIRLDILDTVELSLGARVEAFEVERYNGNRGEHNIDGAFGGPYAGLAFKF